MTGEGPQCPPRSSNLLLVVEQEFDGSNASPAPDGASTADVTWTYDRAGNVTQLDDPNGTTSWTFDELNRRTSESTGALSPTRTYTYDPADNLLTAEVEGDPDATRYAYDEVNLVTSVDDPRSSNDQVLFDYDQHVKTTFPMPGGNNLVQRAHYSDGGHLNCVYSYRVNATPTGVSGDDPDCPAATADGLITFRHYDYTITKNLGVLGSVKYTTNTRYHMTEKGGVTNDYDYDPISRLIGATTSMGGSQLRDFDYTYDRHSNLTKDVTSDTTPGLNGDNSTGSRSGTTFFGYDINDELCWTHTTDAAGCNAPSGATTYAYDGAGDLTSASTGLSLDYNAIGQSSTMDSGTSGDIAMAYTGVTQDRRTAKSDVDMSYGYTGLDRQTRPKGAELQYPGLGVEVAGRVSPRVEVIGQVRRGQRTLTPVRWGRTAAHVPPGCGVDPGPDLLALRLIQVSACRPVRGRERKATATGQHRVSPTSPRCPRVVGSRACGAPNLRPAY